MSKLLRAPLALLIAISLVITGGLAQIAVDSYSHEHESEIVRILIAPTWWAAANPAYAQSIDLLCDGVADYVQWQNAADKLVNGGVIQDVCGTSYNFAGGSVTLNYDDIMIEGVGGGTYFYNDGNTTLFSDDGNARCTLRDLRMDAGGFSLTGTQSYAQHVWVNATYYFQPSGGAGGNVTQEDVEDWAGGMVSGNTETRITVTYDDPTGKLNFVVDDMNDDVPESGDFGNAADLDADGSITDGVIDEADLDAIDAAADEECLTYESSTGQFEWQSCGSGGGNCTNSIGTVTTDSGSVTISGCDDQIWITGSAGISTSAAGSTVTISNVLGASIETGEITNDTILEIDLNITNSPTDNYILSYDQGSGGFTWIQAVDTTLTQEQVEDYAGNMVSGGTETGITVTYDDAAGMFNFIVGVVDISDGTNLTAGDFITLTDDDLDVDTAAVTDGDTTHLSSADAIYDFCETTQDYLKTSENSDLTSYWFTIDTTTGTDETPSGNTTLHFWAGPDIDIESFGNDTVKISYTGSSGPTNYWWTWAVPNGVNLVPSGNSTVTFWDDPYLQITGYANNTIRFDFTGDLTLDDVTLADVQAATSNDFHNIGGSFWWTFDTPIGTGLTPSGNSTLSYWGDPYLDITGIPGNNTIHFDFTGDLTLDDLSDNSIEELIDVATMAQATNDLLYFDGSHWNRLPVAAGYLGSNGTTLGYTTITLGGNTTGNYVASVAGGNYTTVTGAAGEGATFTVHHDAVLRYVPEVFACSMTGNSSTSVGSCEDVDFGGVELSVREIFGGDSTMNFHIYTPEDFGCNGNTTISVSSCWRVPDGNAGGPLLRYRAATTIAGLAGATWYAMGAADDWIAIDETHWTDWVEITAAGISAGGQDLYVTVDVVSEDSNATHLYLDKCVFKAWGV